MSRLPSIRRRLARALLGGSLVWGLAMAAAVWMAVRHEVNELLDDGLRASAEVLVVLVRSVDAGGVAMSNSPMPALAPPAETRFAWQVVDAAGRVSMRSPYAPQAPLHPMPLPGYGDTRNWRTFGMSIGNDGRMLYVAQSREERLEAEAEVTLSTVLAALAIGVLGYFWLRARARQELLPLQRLSDRLAMHDPTPAGATLGEAERQELQPMHRAIDALGRRLADRLAHERAFTAHAAHSLRTPLAGIDAQLAVALRESPPALIPRLQRVREAAGRLQRVVAAMLAMFRSAAELKRQPVDVASLLGSVAVENLRIVVRSPLVVDADPDLLSAALLNLIDNAVRYGAHELVVSQPRSGCIRLHDDGPGVDAGRRQQLQRALDEQCYEGGTGLGLMLADLVARAHGGRMELPQVAEGFAVDVHLEA